MSTLSSWIDSAEISELLPFLLPEEGSEDKAGADESANQLKDGPETEFLEPAETAATPEGAAVGGGTGEISAGESAKTESPADPVETVEVIDGRDNTEPGTGEADPAGTDSSSTPETASAESETAFPGAGSEIDFSFPEAYDAAAFPDTGEIPDAATSPERRAAAVQAAVALERARSRADEVGLLKGKGDGFPTEGPADSDPEEEAELETPGVVGLEEARIPPAAEKAEAAAEPPETLPENEEAAVEPEPGPVPGTFRDRLASFAGNAMELTGGSDPEVTDFESYPLYPASNGNRAGSPRAVESILRMNRLIGQISDQQNGAGETTTQIALNGGRWLCILTRDSASGGVCASLQVPAPVSNETADQLHRGLSTALTASGD